MYGFSHSLCMDTGDQLIDSNYVSLIGLLGHIGVSFHSFGSSVACPFLHPAWFISMLAFIGSGSILPRCYAAWMSGIVSWSSFAHQSSHVFWFWSALLPMGGLF